MTSDKKEDEAAHAGRVGAYSTLHFALPHYTCRRACVLVVSKAEDGGDINHGCRVHCRRGGYKEAVWIRNFINDLRIPGVHIDTVPLYIDNNSALKLTRNPEFHNRSPRR